MIVHSGCSFASATLLQFIGIEKMIYWHTLASSGMFLQLYILVKTAIDLFH